MTEVVPHPEFKALYPELWETRMTLELAIRALFEEFPPLNPDQERHRELALISCWKDGIALLQLRMLGTGVPKQRFDSILMLLDLDTNTRYNARVGKPQVAFT